MPPYNPYPDPFDFRPARQQQPAPGPVLPEDESTILGRLMESSLGGLSYVGKILDKTFGGRALRGALGGKPQELLSVLPMSDTLGLTREQDTVHGKKLLEDLGLITPGDHGWENDLAGVGAEIALDPAMWSGAAVPKLVARGLQGTGRGVGAATEAVTGGRVNPYTYGARQIDRVADPLVRTGRSLFDTSVAETRTREVQPLAQEIFTPQLRTGRQAADEFAADAVVRQKGPGDAYLSRPSRPVPYLQPTQDDVRWAMTQAGEGFAPEARQSLARMGFAPGEADDLVRLAEQVADRGRGVATAERNTGVVSRELVDVPGWQLDANRAVMDAHQAAGGGGPVQLPFSMDGPAQYVPRTAIPLEQPGAFGRAQKDRLSGMSEFQEARDDIFRGLPGGTKSLNDLTKDQMFSGATRETVHGRQDLQVENDLLKMLSGGHGSGPKPAAWTFPGSDAAWAGARKQAKELSDYLKAMPPERLEKGLFNPDIIGNVRAREMESVRTVASGETVLEGIKRFAQPIPVLQQAKQPHVPVEELLNKIGLTHPDPLGGTVAQQRLMQGLGLAGVQDLKGLAVTKDVADDMLRMGTGWRTPESIQPVLTMWDRASSLFKGLLTSPFPAFNIRNIFSGIFNMARDGAANPKAADSMQHLVRGGTLGPEVAGKLYPGLSQAEADQQILKELVANSPAWRRQGGATETVAPVRSDFPLAEQLPKVGGTPNSVAEDVGTFLKGYIPEKAKLGEQLNPLRTRGVLEEKSQFTPVVQGEKVQGTAERWIQGTHYLAKRLEGATPADAKLSMLKYQIDYADMTQFEQHVMKRLFPWYSFCVPIEYEILTHRGWLRPEKLMTGDKALSLNHATGEMEWDEIEAVNAFDYDGEMVCLEARGAKWLCTPNHRWPVVVAKSKVKGKVYGGKRTFVEAEDLNTTHHIPKTGEFRGTESILSPRLAAILGWVVTDGTFRWKGTHCEMVIYQSELKHVEAVEKLVGRKRRPAADRRTNRTTGRNPTAPVHTVPVRIEDVREITKVFKSKKDLTAVVGRRARAAADAMYDAMMLAEGCVSSNGQESFGQTWRTSYVRDAFQILCYMTGRSGNLHFGGCYVSRNKVMQVTNWLRDREHYTGKVWCPTTKNGTWVMRHNGKATITGNSRKNLPPILNDLAEKPALLAASTRVATGTREPGEFVPPWVAEGAAAPVPGAPEGQKRFVASFGLPFEDELVKTIGSGLHGDYQRVLQQMFGMGMPLAKLPAELATGTQMFSGRKLEDLRPYEMAGLGGLLPEDTARQASQVIANTPASRLVNTIDKFADERKGTLPTLLNTLTGVRVQDVETEKVQERAAQKLLQDLLRGQPGVKAREEVYVPKDQMEKLDPNALMEYDLLKEIERRSAQRARERKKASAP